MEVLLALGLVGVVVAAGVVASRSRQDGGRPRPGTGGPPSPLAWGPGSGAALEHQTAESQSSAGVPPPTMEAWAQVLAPACVQRARGLVQLAYALRWVGEESGGNPCAVGDPRAHGPDGMPLELGIAQLYNPDDLRKSGVTGSQLRAYCVPGDQHLVRYRNRLVHGFAQDLSRPLTPDEMQVQADLTMDLIEHSMSGATADLAAVHAGPAWSPSHRDYWRLVKLRHGLPGMSSSGLRKITEKLGRPPANWREFRDNILRVKMDPATEKKRSIFPTILDNAEKAAEAFVEPGVA